MECIYDLGVGEREGKLYISYADIKSEGHRLNQKVAASRRNSAESRHEMATSAENL